MKRLHFLLPSAGNGLLNELLMALAGAARRAGASVGLATDEYPPPADGDAYVLIGREFFECATPIADVPREQLASTVAVGVEQPGTKWFERSAALAAQLGATLNIHTWATHELTRRGLRARHLQLGYAPEWDHWHGDPSARSTDVLYMASSDDRRALCLSRYGELLSAYRTRLLIPPDAPKPVPTPNYLTGEHRYRELASSKLLLNLHRSDSSGLLEWLRIIEAISNGCVVVSEHSLDHAPLLPGSHFVSGRPEDLGLLAYGLLEDPAALAAVRDQAYQLLREELTMDAGIAALVDGAEDVVAASRVKRRSRASTPKTVAAADRAEAVFDSDELESLVAGAVARELEPLRAALKQLALDAGDAWRRLQVLDRGGASDASAAAVVKRAETDTYRSCVPRISVLISLYNNEREVIDALASVASSNHHAFEVLILDDASTDHSVEAVHQFLWNNAWLPAALYSQHTNKELGSTRNALLERARGQYVFVLGTDNTIFPTTLAKLEAALETAPTATFAYGMCAVEEQGELVDLLSVGLWDPVALRDRNYIDAMALIRRRELVELGGYVEDIRLTGWEDYDLWLRMAGAGLYPVHVAEIIGRHRRAGSSLPRSITDSDTSAAAELVRARVAAGRSTATVQLVAPILGAEIEMWLDLPSTDTRHVAARVLQISGWAAADVEIERVSATLGTQAVECRYGLPRADVAAARPTLYRAEWSGFSVLMPTTGLREGAHELTVTALAADGRSEIRRATVEVGDAHHATSLADRRAALEPVDGYRLEVWVLAAESVDEDVTRTVASVERQSLVARRVRVVGAHRDGAESLAAAALSTGSKPSEYIALISAGDLLDEHALAHLGRAALHSRAGVIYGDEDVIVDGRRGDPFYKPAWSPELFAHADYIGPCAAIRFDLLTDAVAARPDAQSVGELITALASDPALEVRHVPRILSTRATPRSRASQPPAAAALTRTPLVSVLIPTAARGEHLERCLRSLVAQTEYGRLELVIIDSSAGRLPDVRALIGPVPVEIVTYSGNFNYSTAVNLGARRARGDYLVLLNDDVEIITRDWIERLLEQALRPGVGIVGCKLLRSDRTVQHGGVFVHEDAAEHLFELFADDDDGYHGLLGVPRNCSAVSAACMMVSAGLYRWIGGLDDSFVLDYGDTDLCLRVLAAGERIVWTPHAVLLHDERSSRGSASPLTDLATLKKHWRELMDRGDPYYNPNLSIRPQFEPRPPSQKNAPTLVAAR